MSKILKVSVVALALSSSLVATQAKSASVSASFVVPTIAFMGMSSDNSTTPNYKHNTDNFAKALVKMRGEKLCESEGRLFGVHKSQGLLEVTMKNKQIVEVVGSDRQTYYLSAFKDRDC